RDIRFKSNKWFILEHFERDTFSLCKRVLRRTGHHHLVPSKRNHLNLPPSLRKGYDSEVNSIVETRLVDFVCPAVFDSDVDLWILLQEALDVRGQFVEAYTVNSSDTDAA